MHGQVLHAWANEVNAALRTQGITRRELAKRMGVTPSRVSHLLNDGCDVELATLRQIAEAIGYRWIIQLEIRR